MLQILYIADTVYIAAAKALADVVFCCVFCVFIGKGMAVVVKETTQLTCKSLDFVTCAHAWQYSRLILAQCTASKFV